MVRREAFIDQTMKGETDKPVLDIEFQTTAFNTHRITIQLSLPEDKGLKEYIRKNLESDISNIVSGGDAYHVKEVLEGNPPEDEQVGEVKEIKRVR